MSNINLIHVHKSSYPLQRTANFMILLKSELAASGGLRLGLLVGGVRIKARQLRGTILGLERTSFDVFSAIFVRSDVT